MPARLQYIISICIRIEKVASPFATLQTVIPVNTWMGADWNGDELRQLALQRRTLATCMTNLNRLHGGDRRTCMASPERLGQHDGDYELRDGWTAWTSTTNWNDFVGDWWAPTETTPHCTAFMLPLVYCSSGRRSRHGDLATVFSTKFCLARPHCSWHLAKQRLGYKNDSSGLVHQLVLPTEHYRCWFNVDKLYILQAQ